ncbi:MAG TPA: DNA polymerase III subunit delta [Chitinophagaceae bacterium]|nr:DNA polymerase III subunit delta [Chitinophagaceae bacterium]
MTADKIIGDWLKGVYKPVYWLEGEEDYFIDKVMHFAETRILSESETGFNLTVFYGKDADWASVINACRRYPMFSERQVVLLKEAQQMRDIDKLESYVENPLKSTVFVVGYKEKKLDGRTRLSKILKEKAVVLTTKKMGEGQLPEWINNLVSSRGYAISPVGLRLLGDHIGNDLSRIENEIDKISVNLGTRKTITEEDIEKFVGVSKEFNVFELQAAIATRNLEKAMRIIQYFTANPKAAPIQLILPSLYGFFSKVFALYGVPSRDEKTLSAALGIHSFFVRDYIKAAQVYSYPEIERVLLLLHEYNLKSIGVGDSGTPEGSLLKEMIVKMIA